MNQAKSDLVVVEGVPVETEEIRKEALKQARKELRKETKEKRKELDRQAREAERNAREAAWKAREAERKAREARWKLQREFPEGRGNWGEEWPPAIIICCLLSLMCSLAAFLGGLIWLSLDHAVATTPGNFFEPGPDCLVLNVTKQFVNRTEGCADRFRYEFTPDSFATVIRVVTQSEEFPRIDSSLCQNPDAVGLEAARFDIGDRKQCLVLHSLYEGYIDGLNCGSPAPPCYSIVPVTSSHDPTIAYALAPVLVVLGCTTFCYWMRADDKRTIRQYSQPPQIPSV